MRVLRAPQRKTNVPSLTTARTIEQIQSLDIYDRGVNRCSCDCSVFFFPVLPGEKGVGTFSGCLGCRQYEPGLSAMETLGELQAWRFSGGLGTGRLLRPGEKLFDRESGVTKRREWSDPDHRGQPIFADAGQIRC